MSDALPLSKRLRVGAMAAAVDREQAQRTITSLSDMGFESVWCGDHVAFTGPISDALTQLTYFSALNPNLTYGTSIYLLPLRHPIVPPGGSARLFNANRSASGISSPPEADHALMPAVTAAVLFAGLTWC